MWKTTSSIIFRSFVDIKLKKSWFYAILNLNHSGLQFKNIICSMICVICALQLLFLVHYVEYRIEHRETKKGARTDGAAGTDILTVCALLGTVIRH